MDFNVFFTDAGQFFASVFDREGKRTRYTLADWHTLAYDKHSVYGDPLFVDAERADYRVKPDSPALRLGFKNFETSGAGLLPDFPRESLESDRGERSG